MHYRVQLRCSLSRRGSRHLEPAGRFSRLASPSVRPLLRWGVRAASESGRSAAGRLHSEDHSRPQAPLWVSGSTGAVCVPVANPQRVSPALESPVRFRCWVGGRVPEQEFASHKSSLGALVGSGQRRQADPPPPSAPPSRLGDLVHRPLSGSPVTELFLSAEEDPRAHRRWYLPPPGEPVEHLQVGTLALAGPQPRQVSSCGLGQPVERSLLG